MTRFRPYWPAVVVTAFCVLCWVVLGYALYQAIKPTVSAVAGLLK